MDFKFTIAATDLLYEHGLKPEWIGTNWNFKEYYYYLRIIPEHQIEAYETLSNRVSHHFKPKTSVDNWALCKPCTEDEKCKIEEVRLYKNNIWLFDSTNRNKLIHVLSV